MDECKNNCVNMPCNVEMTLDNTDGERDLKFNKLYFYLPVV